LSCVSVLLSKTKSMDLLFALGPRARPEKTRKKEGGVFSKIIYGFKVSGYAKHERWAS